MIKDIEMPETKNVLVAIAPDTETQWQVYLINKADVVISNVLISSSGYGHNEKGEKVETSTLRFYFKEISPQSFEIVERIDESVFKLNNEYWVSFWMNDKLYDRRFLFVPESINNNNLIFVKNLDKLAVLHA